MNTPTGTEIKGALRCQPVPGGTREAGAFWADFQAHARLRTQEAPLSPALHRPAVWGWATATACAMVLASWMGLRAFQGADPGGAYNTVKALEVSTSHSAVLLMNDKATRSTVLWIMDAGDGNGKGNGA